jgi:hypothetical protein
MMERTGRTFDARCGAKNTREGDARSVRWHTNEPECGPQLRVAGLRDIGETLGATDLPHGMSTYPNILDSDLMAFLKG